jgi:hypothetical protein
VFIPNIACGGVEGLQMAWGEIKSSTIELSASLCEQLRLLLEPQVCAKMQGDYRTGKRINMKKVCIHSDHANTPSMTLFLAHAHFWYSFLKRQMVIDAILVSCTNTIVVLSAMITEQVVHILPGYSIHCKRLQTG